MSAQDLSALVLPPAPARNISGDDNATTASATADKSSPEGDGKLVAVAATSSAKILHKSSSPVVNGSVAGGGDKLTAAAAAKLAAAVDASIAESKDKSELYVYVLRNALCMLT